MIPLDIPADVPTAPTCRDDRSIGHAASPGELVTGHKGGAAVASPAVSDWPYSQAIQHPAAFDPFAAEMDFTRGVLRSKNVLARKTTDRPTRLFIGRSESRLLNDIIWRNMAYAVEQAVIERRQFMGMDVYVVDAESFLEVMA